MELCLSHGIGILRNNMRKKIILITGANGEIGQELIKTLAINKQLNLVALDLHAPATNIADLLYEKIVGSILDKNLLIDATFLTTDPNSIDFKIKNSFFIPNP